MDTLIHVILDRSGSMYTILEDTIGGYNTFLDTQKDLNIPIKWSTTFFDYETETIIDNVDIKDVPKLDSSTFIPKGGTALYDAIGEIVMNIHAKNTKEQYKKIIIVIITDGKENASKNYSSSAISKIIGTHDNYDFLYLGANQNAILEAKKIGLKENASIEYDTSKAAISAVYEAASAQVKNHISGTSEGIHFTPSQRQLSQPNESHFSQEMQLASQQSPINTPQPPAFTPRITRSYTTRERKAPQIAATSSFDIINDI